jgi:Cupin domain
MKHIVSDIKSFEITRGFSARMIHSESMTIAFVEVEEGAGLPEHAHPHEQVTNVLEGIFEIVVGGQPVLLKAGEFWQSAHALPDFGCFQPRARRLSERRSRLRGAVGFIHRGFQKAHGFWNYACSKTI